jgi:glucosyl-dolichyl phosphate glucuronosyltransferase
MTYSISDVTVIMCTANRLSLAQSFINRFISEFPTTKLIVVDNSLLEENYQALLELTPKSSFITVFRCTPPGLSRARNFAIEKVSTKLVAFTDDDCVPTKNWVSAIAESSLWREACAVGGKILPLFPAGAPKVGQELTSSLAVLDLGSRSRLLKDNEFIYGANMAFQSEVLKRYTFAVNLGRTNGLLLSGEEIALQKELTRDGYKIGYEPKSVVEHLIERERLTPAWFRRRFAWQAVSDVIQNDQDLNWTMTLLYESADKVGLRNLIDELLSNSRQNLDERVLLIRYLTYTLLAQKQEVESSLDFSQYLSAGTRYPPLGKKVEHLVVDFLGFHDFLSAGMRHPSISFYFIPHRPWEISATDLTQEFSSLASQINSSAKNITLHFSSLDSFLHPDYFWTFQEFIDSIQNQINGCIHRFPTSQDEMNNLLVLSKRLKLFSWSSKISSKLKQTCEITTLPILSQFSPKHQIVHETHDSKAKNIRVGFFGELRLASQLDLIHNLILEIGKQDSQIVVIVAGSTKSKVIYSKLFKLARDNPRVLDISTFTLYKTFYRDVSNQQYRQALEKCDVVCKVQIEEKDAGSAVVADCISLGIPVITLRDTEACLSTTPLFEELVVDAPNPSLILEKLVVLKSLVPFEPRKEIFTRERVVMETLFSLSNV